MRETWIGSGINSTEADRLIYCGSCLNEWEESVYFSDTGVADESYICPVCEETIQYFEDRRDKQWEE